MIYVLGGYLSALAAVIVPMLFIPSMRLAAYPDIALACRLIFEGPAACRLGAEQAGYATSAALLLGMLFVVFAARRWSTGPAMRSPIAGTYAAAVLIVGVAATAHWIAQFTGPSSINRGITITRETNFVSAETLVWPLLVQLMNVQRRLRDKMYYGVLLLPLVALSPYRAILVSLVVFGVVLPAGEWWWKRERRAGLTILAALKYVAVASAMLALLLLLIYTQTRSRLEETGMAAPGPQLRHQTERRLAQRLAYPLFQAHFAAAVAPHHAVPTLLDELRTKVRLSRTPDLNQYLYGLVYGGGTVGGMTSLYYGEAAAYAVAPSFIWMIVAPLILVAVWVMLRRRGTPTGTLVGIAIWRGSLGGLIPLLPAVALQIGAMLLLCRSQSGQGNG